MIGNLLNAVNRIFESPGVYRRKSSSAEIPVKAVVESRDVVSFSESAASVSFRFTVFSADSSALAENGEIFKPARGDRFSYGGRNYRIVEFDGVTWKPRFDLFNGRILFFAESESDA